MQLICKSRTYQLSLETNKWNEDDSQNYSHAIARRLPAEVLYDTIHRVVGAKSKIPGVAEGTRAAAIPDAGVKLTDGFLANLGRPVRESACECERSADLQLGPIMALIAGPTVSAALDDSGNAITKLAGEIKDDKKLIDELFVRIFNRPATDQEIQAALTSMNAIDNDHQSVAQELTERDTWWKGEKPKREAARQKSIAETKADLAAYEKQIAPRRAEEEKQRLAKEKAAQADYDKYQADVLKHADAYLKKQATGVEWHLLEARNVAASNGITLERLQDRSIKASGKADRGAYTVVVKTSLTDIAAFRLEALQDTSIKGNGPGLPENGNFVVTEFEVQAAPASKPKEFKKVTLQNAKADFLQAGFNIALAIDGNAGNQNSWAVANAGGVTHWATFETKDTVPTDDGGTLLKFVIHQNHSAKGHLLGRFRISVTQKKTPGLSLPEDLAAVAAVAADKRSEHQKNILQAWFQKSDATLIAKAAALNEAKNLCRKILASHRGRKNWRLSVRKFRKTPDWCDCVPTSNTARSSLPPNGSRPPRISRGH